VSPPSHLKPSESLTEIVAGLIMALTFTLAASVLTGGGQDGARAALLGAIGCNAAWGIIDAVFYMMTSAFDRNRRLRLARAIAATQDEAAALAAIRSELDPYLASVTRAENRERLYRSVHNLLAHGRLPRRTGLLFDDVMGAIEAFCIALAASLPAALPLLRSMIRGWRCAPRTCSSSACCLSSAITGQNTSMPARGRRVSGSWVSAWRWSRSPSC